MNDPDDYPDSSKLVVGDKYLHNSGYTIRTIVNISGSTVTWEDYIGSGECQKATFRKICPTRATEKDIEEYEAMKERRKNEPPIMKRRGSTKRR